MDGDTVRVRLASGGRKDVRMIGIDTPERGACGFTTATNALRRVLPIGTRVKLVSDTSQSKTDRYGRLLRYVHKGTKDTNRGQLSRGVARVYVFNRDPFKRVGSYRTAQRRAKAGNRGLCEAAGDAAGSALCRAPPCPRHERSSVLWPGNGSSTFPARSLAT